MTLTPTYSLKTYTIKSSSSPGTHILNVEHDYSDSDSGLGASTTPVHLAVTPSPSSSQLNRSNLFVTPSSSARAQKSLLGGPVRSEARRRLDLDNSPQVLFFFHIGCSRMRRFFYFRPLKTIIFIFIDTRCNMTVRVSEPQ